VFDDLAVDANYNWLGQNLQVPMETAVVSNKESASHSTPSMPASMFTAGTTSSRVGDIPFQVMKDVLFCLFKTLCVHFYLVTFPTS